MWDLPGSGIISKSPAWAGGFFTTEPPGKPQALYFGSPLLIVPFYRPKCEMVASFEIIFAIFFFLFDNLKKIYGTSLVVQWLRCPASTAGARVCSLVRELRSCWQHSMGKKKNLLAQVTEKLKGDLTQVDLGV